MIRRIPPCPDYDTEATGAWLEDMAAQGYFLDKNGFRWGLAFFQTGEPRQVRYQADPLDRKNGDDTKCPSSQKCNLYADFGWVYTAQRGAYYYYRCDDPAAPELNSDPDLQAAALKSIQRQEQSNFLIQFFWIVIHFYLIGLKGAILMIPVELGLPFFTLLVLFDLLILGRVVVRIRYLRRLRQMLMGQRGRKRTAPTAIRRWRHWLSCGVSILLVFAFCASFAELRYENGPGKQVLLLESVTEPLPFGTLSDLFPHGTIRYDQPWTQSTLEVSSTTLAPTIIKMRQSGDVYENGGRRMFSILYVDYYEMRAPWMAQELAREIQRKDRWEGGRYFAQLTAPELQADNVSAYHPQIMDCLVLVQGNRVCKLQCLCDNPTVDWMGTLGQMFLDRIDNPQSQLYNTEREVWA